MAFYRLNSVSGCIRPLHLQLSKPVGINANVAPRIKVYRSNGSQVAESGDTRVARVAFTAEAMDTLTVLTLNDGTEKDVDEYRLYTAIVPQGFLAATGDEGGVLLNGITAIGKWEPRGDIDLYAYSNVAGAGVSLFLECKSDCISATPVMQVYSSDGTLIGLQTGDVATLTLNYIAQANDSLTVLVFNNNGGESSDYELTATGITSLDSDGDGLSDALEILIGSNPASSDTDGDGLSDFDEVNYDMDASGYDPTSDLNPLFSDTDNDGVDDATELLYATDPLDPGDFFFLLGDLNFDRVVNLGDYLLLIRFVSGAGAPPSVPQKHSGDMNSDGQLDASDIVTHMGLILS